MANLVDSQQPEMTNPAADVFSTVEAPINLETMSPVDVVWVLTCTILIFTMQTGFALLEAGCVAAKNVTNIMIKNTVDVLLGGLSFWMFGYALGFGVSSNGFCGLSGFFLRHNDADPAWGSEYARYIFQLSFATTSTTIVSGAVAERMNFHAYLIYSFLNTLTYCFPACWAWNADGWLFKRGFYDYAGACVVHMKGGASALVAAIIIGPRLNRFRHPEKFSMSSPVTSMTGMMMLWWSWLGFNCGSTFGVWGDSWRVMALVSVTTINGSIGGGLAGMLVSMILRRGKLPADFLANSILGGLVGITGCASIISTWEAIIVGFIGGALTIGAQIMIEKLQIDDPVGAIPVHFFGGVWGTMAVGLFGQDNKLGHLQGNNGAFHGGGGYLLGYQLAGMLAIGVWSTLTTVLVLLPVHLVIGLRMKQEDEILGADWVEHDIRSSSLAERLRAVLEGIDEEQFTNTLRKLMLEVNNGKSLQAVSGRNRIFTVDTGAHMPARRNIEASTDDLRGITFTANGHQPGTTDHGATLRARPNSTYATTFTITQDGDIISQ